MWQRTRRCKASQLRESCHLSPFTRVSFYLHLFHLQPWFVSPSPLSFLAAVFINTFFVHQFRHDRQRNSPQDEGKSEKVGLGSSASETGKGKSKISKHVTHGYHLVEGKSNHAMEDYVFAEFKQVGDNELGLFAIFDGHLSHEIPAYLRSHLFDNILREPDFWTETENAVRRAYRITGTNILEKAVDLGKGGSTAVTAILINCQKLVVANVGDSRAVICRNGQAKQLSVDHEPIKERKTIEERGGFVSNFPGDVPRVDGQLAVARALMTRA